MKTITSITPFPAAAREADLAREVAQRLAHGALACRIVERDGGYALVTVRPGPQALQAALRAEPATEAPLEAAARWSSARADGAAHLGALSERYESNGDPAAIGEDRVGGPSYGAWQIATRPGTMASYLSFLARTRPDFFARLQAAGGDVAARARAPRFVSAWRALAADRAFLTAQRAFIQATHYEPFVARLARDDGLAVARRSRALRNVAWSVAVQHGPATSVFAAALATLTRGARTDRRIIEAVYDERARVDRHFRRSTAPVKAALRRRFAAERQAALDMLALG